MSTADQTWVNINQACGVPCRKPRHRLGGRNIVASKTHLPDDQVLVLVLALAAWLVVVSVFGWIDWELP